MSEGPGLGVSKAEVGVRKKSNFNVGGTEFIGKVGESAEFENPRDRF